MLYGVVHCCARPELPPEMPAAYASLIECCWSADPDMRCEHRSGMRMLHGDIPLRTRRTGLQWVDASRKVCHAKPMTVQTCRGLSAKRDLALYSQY